MTSIPASELVRIVPSVNSAGGQQLALNSVFLSEDDAIPVNAVLAFPTSLAVSNFFGPTSDEAALAAVYFNGFEGATVLPSMLLFSRWVDRAASAYVRGGSMAAVTLAQLQTLSGTLIIVIDGRTVTSASIDLSSATSFSNAAALMQTGLRTTGGIFAGTASLSDGAGGSGTDLDIEAVTSGAVHTGDVVLLNGVTSTTILSQVSGTPGGVGRYTVTVAGHLTSVSATVTSAALVTYDSQRAAFVVSSGTTGPMSTIGYSAGTLAAGVHLTQATGAVLSQGADASTAAGVMNNIVQMTQNWALFMTVWEPDLTTKEAFAAWTATSNNRYAYVGWDTDVTPTLSNDAPSCFAQLTKTGNGRIAMWGPADKAALVCAIAASTNFNETQGRVTYAYRQQSGLVPDVTDATVAANLLANGYNFYGNYAADDEQFQCLQNGQISGSWNWIDSYINQIRLNSDLQLAFLELFVTVKSVPYAQRGYNLLRAAASDPINSALNFGSIQPGVALSNRQIAEIDNSAGQSGVGRTVSLVGYYLQILPADANTRAGRGSPPMTLWYADGGSVQKIDMASIDVQ